MFFVGRRDWVCGWNMLIYVIFFIFFVKEGKLFVENVEGCVGREVKGLRRLEKVGKSYVESERIEEVKDCLIKKYNFVK